MAAGRLIAGRYRLQDPIGRGAMGIVWRGRDELLERDVAVKEVQIAAQASPGRRREAIYQRTLREAKAAARLNHPGVVTVFDVVEEDGSPWIVMELVEARSLDRVIAEDGPLPPLQAAGWARTWSARWPARTLPGCCTATSSRATCWSAADGRPC